jgi:hypothetical protein
VPGLLASGALLPYVDSDNYEGSVLQAYTGVGQIYSNLPLSVAVYAFDVDRFGRKAFERTDFSFRSDYLSHFGRH